MPVDSERSQPTRVFRARIVANVPVTPRSRLVTLDISGTGLHYAPGQAVIVGPRHGSDRRAYSIACSPERAAETNQIDLLIGTRPLGSNGFDVSALAPSESVDVEGPVGTLVYDHSEPPRPVLMVAGGSGIAPLRTILDHLLRRRPVPAPTMIYSARQSDEFAFIDELRTHANEGRMILRQTVTREQHAPAGCARGRIGLNELKCLLPDPSATVAYISGPPALVREARRLLRLLDVADIKIEQPVV